MRVDTATPTIAQTFLDEFMQESKTTKKFLEQIPVEQLNWKPHEKSMTVGQLAYHLATAPAGIITMAELDQMPVPDFSRPNPQPTSLPEILAAFDEGVRVVKESLKSFSDEAMKANWQLVRGDKVLIEMPRTAMIRSFLLNHCYHHRGQLGVYLRLLGAVVPFSYGPSGDEMPDFVK